MYAQMFVSWPSCLFRTVVLAAACLSGFTVHARADVLVLVGDSTVAANDGNDGWGDALIDFLPAGSSVDNRALNGRSTKSYITERHWRSVVNLTRAPDYVLIQFGHNDQKLGQPTLGAYAVDDPNLGGGGDGGGFAPVAESGGVGLAPVVATNLYRENLRQMIDSARGIGAQPILITPVARRNTANWTSVQAQIDRNNEVLWTDALGNGYSLRDYADAAIAVGREKQVGVIDLNQLSLDLYAEVITSGGNLQALGSDGTHFTQAAMPLIAELVADALPDAMAVPEPAAGALCLLPLMLTGRRRG